MTERALELMRDSRTYLRIIYLLLAFPLATAYFIVIVTGLSVGVGLSIIIVGLFVLVLTLVCWLLFAAIERTLTIHLLGARKRPAIAESTPLSAWPRLLKTLADPVTWKSLVYLIIEFPFGIFAFTLAITLISISLTFLLYPFIYAALTSLYQQDPGIGQIEMFPGLIVDGQFKSRIFVELFGFSALGVVFAVVSAAVLSGLGWLWARFAEFMLWPTESAVQLASARADAETQRGRAERSDQSRRELIVSASHELRTPVASISAHVESLLKPSRELDEETRKYLTVVAAETERLGSLVDDVLALARADADELHLDIRPVVVPEVLDQVCDTLAPLAKRERNLSLVHSSAEGLPRAMADRDRLAQVLTNLIRNAVNYTPEGGIISVGAEAAGDLVMITVADTGIGMEPQDLARVFDRFYRTDQSRARDSGGSGLGLAIVRDLLTAMGASIDAESTPGQGSVFRVRLPREKA